METKMEINDLFNLSGKVAIVTGGAKGIGEGITIRLAQAGAKVMICDIDTAALDKAVQKFRTFGLEVAGICADISNEDDCRNTVIQTVETYGGVDIMVNNAAYYPTIPLLKTTQADWDKVYAINCRGAFLMSRETAKIIIEQNKITPERGGSVIFIASLGAQRANRVGMSAYHSSKGAILSLKNDLSGELAPYNIRVNCVLPGAINSMIPDENGVFQPIPMPANKVPLRRMGVPFDIANATLFLASPAAEYITGIEILVDGGMYKLPTFGYSEEQKVIREYSTGSGDR